MFLGHKTRYYKLFCKQFERSHFSSVSLFRPDVRSGRPKTTNFQFWFENPENIFYTNCLHSKEGKSICQHMSRADFCLPSLIFQFWVLLNFSKSGPSAGGRPDGKNLTGRRPAGSFEKNLTFFSTFPKIFF